jgi:syncollin
MKRILVFGVFVVISLVATARVAYGSDRTCTIFNNRDYGGAHWTLHNGDDMKMINQPDVGISDGIHRFIYEPSWNDKVSSFKVGPGCTLTLWENVDHGGHHFRSNRSYKYVGDRWNDKASEAICECTGLPNF